MLPILRFHLFEHAWLNKFRRHRRCNWFDDMEEEQLGAGCLGKQDGCGMSPFQADERSDATRMRLNRRMMIAPVSPIFRL